MKPAFFLRLFLFPVFALLLHLPARAELFRLSGKLDGKIPVHLLLDSDSGTVCGMYYYDRVRSVIFLQGTVAENGSYRLREYTILQYDSMGTYGSPVEMGTCTGLWEGRWTDTQHFGGSWSDTLHKKSLPFVLQRDSVPVLKPAQVVYRLNKAEDDAEFLFHFCTYFTGSCGGFSFFTYGGRDYLSGSSVIGTAGLIKAQVFYRNLFGDTAKEAVMEAAFRSFDSGNDMMVLAAAYRDSSRNWKRVNDFRFYKGMNSSEKSCLAENDYNYFIYSFQELREKGRYIIEGRTYGGRCADFYPRGDHITYYLLEIDRAGFHTLYEETEKDYWYSYSPAPTEAPLEREFKLVPGKNQPFPRRLRIIDYEFVIEEGSTDFPEIKKQPARYVEPVK